MQGNKAGSFCIRALRAVVLLGLLLGSGAAVADGLTTFAVPPQDTDQSVRQFLSSSLVMMHSDGGEDRGLLIFLPGSARRQLPPGGAPFPYMRLFLRAAAEQGYRVIALQYNNSPSVMQVCARDPDGSCPSKVREKRSFGDNATNQINDAPAEAIASRLAHLLAYLAHHNPGQGWEAYIAGGKPRWDKIALAGHSQGAGMAAYIAKKVPVARVVLLSGPVDFNIERGTLAPWISASSATPADRWFGVYHARERFADMLARSYAALSVPPSHIRILSSEPVDLPTRTLPDPYHVSIIADVTTPRNGSGQPVYLPDWQFVIGSPD